MSRSGYPQRVTNDTLRARQAQGAALLKETKVAVLHVKNEGLCR